MCAEFIPSTEIHDLEALLFGLGHIQNIFASQKFERVFPRQKAPILVAQKDGRKIELLESEFSLIPRWWKDDKSARPPFATHNARLESILEKPAFRDAFKKNPCVIPMACFFESSLFGNNFPGNRIRIEAKKTLYAAGCFSDWVNTSTGEITSSFTILTKTPGEQIFFAGHDRSPLFLPPQGAKEWLQSQALSGPEKVRFLSENEDKKLRFDISVDRPLKPGWQQRAPSGDEISELKEIIFADKAKN